jgi:hypothetical protein
VMSKRVRVPFPPAALPSSTVVKPPALKAARHTLSHTHSDTHSDIHSRTLPDTNESIHTDNTQSKEQEEEVKEEVRKFQLETEQRNKEEIKILEDFAAESHPYSCRLCGEYASASVQSKIPKEIVRMTLYNGKITFDVKLGRSDGYGCGVWTFRLGGGVGDDMSPVALRCTNRISHYQVDDMGFVSSLFWESLQHHDKEGDLPSLLDIVTGVIKMLEGPFVVNKLSGGDSTEDLLAGYPPEVHQERWEVAERDAAAKFSRILDYRTQALLPMLVGDVSVKKGSTELGTGIFGESPWPDKSWLVPSFIELWDTVQILSDPTNKPEHVLTVAESVFRSFVTEESKNIYSFDLFTEDFCDTLLKELDNYDSSGLPQRRPNTMNNYGIIVNEIGMQSLMDGLLGILEPIVKKLFATEPVVYGLDHHHSFVVQYKSNHLKGDRGLDMHHDASEVTMNVCLGRDNFRGGDLLFCGMADGNDHRKYQFSYKHVKGRAVIHLGRHRHGAEDIIPAHDSRSGDDAGVDSERLNLIMWLRSSVFRSAAAYGHISPDGFPRMKEDVEPDICCLSKYNDTDFDDYQ